MLIHNFLERSAIRFPDKIALIYKDEKLPYKELNHYADQLAAFLVRQGLIKGDRVVIFLDNSMETVISIFAILKAGGTFVLPNSAMKSKKLNYILSDSGARMLITQLNKLNTVKDSITASLDIAAIIWCTGNEKLENSPINEHFDRDVYFEWASIFNDNNSPNTFLYKTRQF